MPVPTPKTTLSWGWGVAIVFSATNPDVKAKLKELQLGIFFDLEVSDDTIHAMIVDPRFSVRDVENYIIELGGTVA